MTSTLAISDVKEIGDDDYHVLVTCLISANHCFSASILLSRNRESLIKMRVLLITRNNTYANLTLNRNAIFGLRGEGLAVA